MKQYIRTSYTESDYIPEPFTSDFVNDVLGSIKSNLERKLSPRYIHLDIVVDDVKFEGTNIHATFDIYPADKPMKSYKFNFSAWGDYFDASDFREHLARTIAQFLEDVT